jgi:hypothetical protein
VVQVAPQVVQEARQVVQEARQVVQEARQLPQPEPPQSPLGSQLMERWAEAAGPDLRCLTPE